MTKSTKSQTPKKERSVQNILETLKDIGASSADALTKDILRPEDFLEQIIGFPQKDNFSGDIAPGEQVEMEDVFSGKRDEDEATKSQLNLERQLLNQERAMIEKKTNELKIQLQAIMEEVVALSQSTSTLAKEVQIAAMQAPIEPGVYHVIFFEKLLEFIKSFRKKVDEAAVWLYSTNKRAEKKNYWSMYKKKGSSFLLSPDHYLQRSAG